LEIDPGTVVANRYRIQRPLGRGGMGEVFAAENIRTGRPVAIKLLRQDTKGKSSAIARFRQEARAAGSINSDHVTQVLDVEEDPEHGVVLVFELLEGESLIDRLKRTGPLPFDELWPIIEQVWLGLADAHRAGIIHRDLKPSNVFLERRPDGIMRVKILDFGISKVPKEAGGETLTEMGQSLGTFSFMPPEQIGKAKTVDHRADIYACATLIYQSLTGQLPYAARNILIMVEMKTKTDARTLADALQVPVDPRLEAFVARGLARDASKRFQTAVEALAAWRELRPHAQSGGTPSRSPSQPPPPRAGSDAASMMPRAPPGAVILENAGGLPRVNTSDVVEMSTEETAATLAMPVSQLKKGSVATTPPLAPRLDTAAALRAVQQMHQGPRASVGPVPAGPVSPAPPVSADRVSSAPMPAPPNPGQIFASGAPGVLVRPAGLPKTYEDPTSSQSSSEARTRLYKPKALPEQPRPKADTVPAVRTPPKRQVPLPLVLLGFLLVGFIAVAGVLFLFRKH
jgi:serine/threonine-protein kinase